MRMNRRIALQLLVIAAVIACVFAGGKTGDGATLRPDKDGVLKDKDGVLKDKDGGVKLDKDGKPEQPEKVKKIGEKAVADDVQLTISENEQKCATCVLDKSATCDFCNKEDPDLPVTEVFLQAHKEGIRKVLDRYFNDDLSTLTAGKDEKLNFEYFQQTASDGFDIGLCDTLAECVKSKISQCIDERKCANNFKPPEPEVRRGFMFSSLRKNAISAALTERTEALPVPTVHSSPVTQSAWFRANGGAQDVDGTYNTIDCDATNAGFRCTQHDPIMAQAVQEVLTEDLTLSSPSRGFYTKCRPTQAVTTPMKAKLFLSKTDKFLCAWFSPLSGAGALKQCGDAMQDNICHCYKRKQDTKPWAVDNIDRMGQEEFKGYKFASHWKCGPTLIPDAEVVLQAVPCSSPNRLNDDATSDEKHGVADCTMLPEKFHPMPRQFIRDIGRPRYTYVPSDLDTSSAARDTFRQEGVAAIVRMSNEKLYAGTAVFNHAQKKFTLTVLWYKDSAVGSIWKRQVRTNEDKLRLLAEKTQDLVESEMLVKDEGPIDILYSAIAEIFPTFHWTVHHFVNRFGVIKIPACTLLYHTTSSGFHFENEAKGYTPRRVTGASFLAFDWHYSANVGSYQMKGHHMVEYATTFEHHVLNLGFFSSYAALKGGRSAFQMMFQTKEGNPRITFRDLVFASAGGKSSSYYRNKGRWGEWYDVIWVGEFFVAYFGHDYFMGREISYAQVATCKAEDGATRYTYGLRRYSDPVAAVDDADYKFECGGDQNIKPTGRAWWHGGYGFFYSGYLTGNVYKSHPANKPACKVPRSYVANPDWRAWFPRGITGLATPAGARREDLDDYAL